MNDDKSDDEVAGDPEDDNQPGHDDHADDVLKNWHRKWKQKLEHDGNVRRLVHTSSSSSEDQKKLQKDLRKYFEHHNRGNQFGQQKHDN